MLSISNCEGFKIPGSNFNEICQIVDYIAKSLIRTKFIEERSRYEYATAKSIRYKALPNNLTYFKYAMPLKHTRNFYILSYFHRGDGRVALVTSESGNLAVVKFLYQNGDLEYLREELLVEQNRWKTFWQVQCQINDLNGQCGLMMPFINAAASFRRFKLGTRLFLSMNIKRSVKNWKIA